MSGRRSRSWLGGISRRTGPNRRFCWDRSTGSLLSSLAITEAKPAPPMTEPAASRPQYTGAEPRRIASTQIPKPIKGHFFQVMPVSVLCFERLYDLLRQPRNGSLLLSQSVGRPNRTDVACTLVRLTSPRSSHAELARGGSFGLGILDLSRCCIERIGRDKFPVTAQRIRGRTLWARRKAAFQAGLPRPTASAHPLPLPNARMLTARAQV